jgi:hypothetical protein
VCKVLQKWEYDANLGEVIKISCEVDANPSKGIAFEWHQMNPDIDRHKVNETIQNKQPSKSGIPGGRQEEQSGGSYATIASKNSVRGVTTTAGNEILSSSVRPFLSPPDSPLSHVGISDTHFFNVSSTGVTSFLSVAVLQTTDMKFACKARNSAGEQRDACIFKLSVSGQSSSQTLLTSSGSLSNYMWNRI